MNRLVSIQCLRFFAASGVVLGHCASGKFLIGSFGVDIFFVISGYIITKVMARRHWIEFIKDRVSRIYPIYWICLFPVTIAGWDSDWLRLLTSVTLWPVLVDFRTSYLGVAWTLCFEMLFYSAAALVLWRQWTIAILLLAFGLCVGAAHHFHDPVLYFFGNTMILEFLMGVFLAFRPATQFRKIGGLFVAVGLIAAAYGSNSDFGHIENMFNGVASTRWVAWGVPAALIFWGLMQFEDILQGPFFDFCAAGGDASYALYLSHPVFLLLKPENPYVLLFLGPPTLIGLGFIMHYQVEKPLLRYVRGFLARRQPAVAAQKSNDALQADP